MIRIISAVSKNGVIGKNNDLPWAGKYKEDMQFFRKMTAGATVIMGRRTFESMGSKPLPKRKNIVVSRTNIDAEGVITYKSLDEAILCPSLSSDEQQPNDTWLIGGSQIYQEGMINLVDDIFLTLIPEIIEGENLTFFPWVNPVKFHMTELINLQNSDLQVARYIRQ